MELHSSQTRAKISQPAEGGEPLTELADGGVTADEGSPCKKSAASSTSARGHGRWTRIYKNAPPANTSVIRNRFRGKYWV